MNTRDTLGPSAPGRRCEPERASERRVRCVVQPDPRLLGHDGQHHDNSTWIGDTYLLTPFARTEADVAAEEVSVNLGDATPRRLLVDWANGQDAWVRQITAETILSRQAPSDALLDAAYTTFLAEKGLGDGETPEMLVALPYVLIASLCSGAAANGGPGWLHLIVLCACWNALKFIIMGPVRLGAARSCAPARSGGPSSSAPRSAR